MLTTTPLMDIQIYLISKQNEHIINANYKAFCIKQNLFQILQNNNLTSSSIINQINQNTNKSHKQTRIEKIEQTSSDIFNERLSRFEPIAKNNSFPFVENIFYKNK